MRWTVVVTLEVDDDDAALREETIDQFHWGIRYVTDYAFEGEYVTTSKTTLNGGTHDGVREVTDLRSNHTNQSATRVPNHLSALSNSRNEIEIPRNYSSVICSSCTSYGRLSSTTSM